MNFVFILYRSLIDSLLILFSGWLFFKKKTDWSVLVYKFQLIRIWVFLFLEIKKN